MTADICNTIQSCLDCLEMENIFSFQCKPELFTPSGPLVIDAIDIHGPLPHTKSRIQFVLIVTDRYSKLTQAIGTADIRLIQVANKVFNQCVASYGIPVVILSENGQQSISSFFKSIGANFEVNEGITIA